MTTNGLNYTKRPLIIPKGRKINQHFPFKGSPKYTQIGIFGLRINYLATQNRTLLAAMLDFVSAFFVDEHKFAWLSVLNDRQTGLPDGLSFKPKIPIGVNFGRPLIGKC
jgi:hypothetical protein